MLFAIGIDKILKEVICQIQELSSLIYGWGDIHIGHNVNFTVKPNIIKTVHAFHLMLLEQNPESALNPPIH